MSATNQTASSPYGWAVCPGCGGPGQCPTCGRESRFLSFFQEWYGWDETCLRCGERWMDGEQLPRPFERAWRKKSIAEAKLRWRRLRDAEGKAAR